MKKTALVWIVSAYLFPSLWVLRNYRNADYLGFTSVADVCVSDYLEPGMAAFGGNYLSRLAKYVAIGIAKDFIPTGAEEICDFAGIDRTAQFSPTSTGLAVGRGTKAVIKAHPWLVPFYVFFTILQLALYVLFLRGIWNLVRTKQYRLLFLIVIPMGVLLLLSALTDPGPRFRAPMMPFLCFGAAFFSDKKINAPSRT